MEKYVSVKDIGEAALLLLPKGARDYYKSGATDEQTLAENKLAFQRSVNLKNKKTFLCGAVDTTHFRLLGQYIY